MGYPIMCTVLGILKQLVQTLWRNPWLVDKHHASRVDRSILITSSWILDVCSTECNLLHTLLEFWCSSCWGWVRLLIEFLRTNLLVGAVRKWSRCFDQPWRLAPTLLYLGFRAWATHSGCFQRISGLSFRVHTICAKLSAADQQSNPGLAR